MRILHLTDIHYTADDTLKIKFHAALADYLRTYFSKNDKPDAVVLSGDFGDHCYEQNVIAAIKWLEDVLLKIGASKDCVIISPGNHDIINDRLPEDHHIVRLDYDRAITHIKRLSDEVYELYENICKALAPSFLAITTIKNVRFITLNSSWLSQNQNNAKKVLVDNLLKESNGDESKIAQAVFEKFGVSFTINGITKSGDLNKPLPILDNVLNLSENKTQQLGLYHKYKSLKELLNEMNDEKLNVLVFHHPETHLHPFERYPVEIDDEVYSTYYYLTLKSQLLLCGHTHPSEAEDIAMAKRYLQHNFVGGGAHLRKGISAATPMFYIYDVNNQEHTNNFEVNKLMFVYDRDSFRMDTTAMKSDPIKIPLLQNRLGINAKGFVSPKIEIESFLKLKAKLRSHLSTELLNILQKVDPSFTLERQFDVIDITEGKTTFNVLRHRSTLKSPQMNLPIIFDIYFCDELDFGPERKSVAALIMNGYKSQDNKECIYYPLFVNPYSAFVKEDYLEETKARINADVDLFCQDYSIILKGIYSAVRSFYPQIISTPGVTFPQKLWHIDEDTCKAVLHTGM